MQALGKSAPFRLPRLGAGELPVEDSYGATIWLRVRNLPKNVLFCAAPGVGKSQALDHFSEHIIPLDNGPCQWVFATYKTEHRHLLASFRRQRKALIILRPPNWRFNPLQAGPGDPRAHLNQFTDLANRVLEFPDRAQSIFQQICHDLYREWGIFSGRTDAYPTMHHIYERVWAWSGLNATARSAILDRLAALLPGLGPPYLKGWHPTDLLRRNILFEMPGALEKAKHLFTAAHVFGVLHFVYAHSPSVVSPRLVIFIEDAQRMAREANAGNHLPTLEEYMAVNRGGGICLWLILQSLDGISRQLLATCGNKFMGMLGSHADYQLLGADMAMTGEQIDWAKLNLKTRMFIAHIADDVWRLPFLFRIPQRTGVLPVVDDAEAAETLRALDDLHTVPAVNFANWEPHHVIEVRQVETQPQPRWTEPEWRYVRAVVAEPGKASSYYARLAGVNGKRAAEIRRRLIDGGYIREHALATERRGRTAIVIEPLEPAIEVVRTGGGR